MTDRFGLEIPRHVLGRPSGNRALYRAVHFELAVNTHGRRVYFELQALTLARDAVGLLDHDVLYKSEAELDFDPYRHWLNQLRNGGQRFRPRSVTRRIELKGA